MNYVSWEISLIALLPALFLCGFIYYKDRIEREPPLLLLLLFLCGTAAYYPTMLLQRLFSHLLDLPFSRYITIDVNGTAQYSSKVIFTVHSFLVSFLAIALVEILVKWCILFFFTRNNRHFNYLFDGIVYSVFISLGFSALDNIRFAWINGWETLALRTLSQVPSHLFVGILMGYYFSRWHAHKRAQEIEEELLCRGAVTESRMSAPRRRLFMSFLLPLLVSGSFFFTGAIDSVIVQTLFCFVVFSLYGVSFISVDRIASQDSPSKRFSEKLLKECYPELSCEEWSALLASSEEQGGDAE